MIGVRGVIRLEFWAGFGSQLGVLNFEYVDVVALGVTGTGGAAPRTSDVFEGNSGEPVNGGGS